MSDTEFDVVIAAYLIPDLARKDFDELVKLVGDKQLKGEGAALVSNDADGNVTVTETGDHLGRKGPAGVEMSAGACHVVTGIRSASRPQDVRVGRGRPARDPRGSAEAGDVITVPLAGQPGHGITASIRRQPARIVQGRKKGGSRDAFEVICCDCGDHPYRDYSEISLSPQRIRGPYTTMAAALVAYDQHLGLTTARRRS